MKPLKICPSCHKYTLKEVCCGPTISPKPPKYSPQDKYAKWRRQAKQQ